MNVEERGRAERRKRESGRRKEGGMGRGRGRGKGGKREKENERCIVNDDVLELVNRDYIDLLSITTARCTFLKCLLFVVRVFNCAA